MSIIRADSIKNRGGNGAPDFPKGLTVTGVVTATTLNQTVTGDLNVGSNIKQGAASGIVTASTFVGALTGNVTGNASGTAGGLAGTPAITVGNIIAADGTFSGNVSIGKTLTYEDVTNIDSVGVVTAREGVFIPDTKALKIGNTSASPDLKIRHDGTNNHIEGLNGATYIGAVGNVEIRNTDSSGSNAEWMGRFIEDGAVELYHNNVKKIETSSAGITVTGSVTDDKGDVRVIPKVAKTSSYTLVASDAGKCISTNSGVTIPNAVFSAGQAVTIWNDSSSSITISQGSGFQLRKAGATSTGNVTLTNFGLATLWWNTGGTAVITGNLA